MLIKITNRDLDRQDFTEAIRKLNDTDGLTGSQSYWIMRLTKQCDKQVSKMREEFTQLVRKYATKKEDGSIAYAEDNKPLPTTGFPFDIEDKEGWKLALNEMYEDGFSTKFPKFSMDDLCTLGFKPRELHAIEMLIEEPELDDDPPECDDLSCDCETPECSCESDK